MNEGLLSDSLPHDDTYTPQLLIGNDYYWDLFPARPNTREVSPGLYLVQSKLGLLLTGRTDSQETDDVSYATLSLTDGSPKSKRQTMKTNEEKDVVRHVTSKEEIEKINVSPTESLLMDKLIQLTDLVLSLLKRKEENEEPDDKSAPSEKTVLEKAEDELQVLCTLNEGVCKESTDHKMVNKTVTTTYPVVKKTEPRMVNKRATYSHDPVVKETEPEHLSDGMKSAQKALNKKVSSKKVRMKHFNSR